MSRLLFLASLLPTRASHGAREIDAIFWALVAFSSLLVLIVVGLMVFYGIRYRAGREADRSGRQASNLRVEAIWIAIPSVIGLVFFAWAAKVYLEQGRPPADARTVYVVAKQWMWKIQHAEGVREINELHVPAGEPTKLVMTSQDVIHSFYVPALRTKQDVLPDRYTTLWFAPDEPGVYNLFCAEFCGTSHSDMRGRVIVMEPQAFATWLSAESRKAPAPGTPGTAGADLAGEGRGAFFRYGCNSCHLPSSAVRAPRLDGIWGQEIRLKGGGTVTADEEYVRESILEPQAKISAGYPEPSLMPTYRGQVSERDLAELVEFVASLRDGWPDSVLVEPEAETATADTAAATREER